MAQLAGFDVIGELHKETIIDLLNLTPVANPVDGKSIYLFGGPFSTDLSVNLGPLGAVTLRVILEATLQAVVHQPLTQVTISITGGSTAVAGRSLSHIGGQVTVSVPLGFALPPPPQPGPSSQRVGQAGGLVGGGSADPAGGGAGQVAGGTDLCSFCTAPAPTPPPVFSAAASQVPVLFFGATDPTVVLDDPTRSLADAILGQGGAERLTSGVRGAIAALLAVAGTRAAPAVGFTVAPGVDSANPLQLSAPPVVAWIDATTLGVFGFYRAAATGGNVAAKTTSDLVQPREEFFYLQSGTMPGRRVALLLSADAFRRVIACPAIRNVAVRGLVEAREQDTWVARVRDQCGDSISTRLTGANLIGYAMDEIQKHPEDDWPTQLSHAKDRVQADVNSAINSCAHAAEDDWLDKTPDGQRAITEAIPPPCGGGTVEAGRQRMPSPFADLVPYLRRFEVTLGSGRITVHSAVDGNFEFVAGDITFSASVDVDIVITVTDTGLVDSTAQVHDPVVNVTPHGFLGDLDWAIEHTLIPAAFDYLSHALFKRSFWQAVFALVGVRVGANTLDEILAQLLRATLQNMLAGNLSAGLNPNLSNSVFPARLVDARIEPDSLMVLGLICRRLHWNEFNPALLVDATLDSRVPATQPPIHGKLTFKATDWGCPAASFDTVRTFWETSVKVRARLRDAPLPITVLGWQMELGNFSWNSVGLDPRPTWSGEPVAIVAGLLTLAGKVEHPDPPIAPYMRGALQHRTDIAIRVEGDADNGWLVHFRGIDGNFYVRFALDVRDGEGTLWHGETFTEVVGDQLELPVEYTQYKVDCDAKYASWSRIRIASLSKVVAVGQVQPGQPVMNGETREAVAIRTLVAAGDPAALRQLVAAVEKFGPGIARQVGLVSAMPIVPLRGAGQKLM